MKNRKLKLITVVSLLFGAVFTVSAANQTTANVTIQNITNWGSNGSEQLLIRTTPENTVNPAGCTSTAWIVMDTTSSDISRSMVLAAKMGNKTVNFVIHGGVCDVANRPVVVSVVLP